MRDEPLARDTRHRLDRVTVTRVVCDRSIAPVVIVIIVENEGAALESQLRARGKRVQAGAHVSGVRECCASISSGSPRHEAAATDIPEPERTRQPCVQVDTWAGISRRCS